jgi:D-beta-D-heptose 7-phosphate kinase/D-beta-D-heptose 1-phosphate adenosyltransferase
MYIVIGDFICDEFCYGKATRISPEAPNLILDLDDVVHIKGGAYNVVEHLRSLGDDVCFVSLIGSKNIGHFGSKILFSDDDNVIIDPFRLQTVKSRMVSRYRHTTLLRVDQEERGDISQEQENMLLKFVEKIIESGKCNGICIIDYCKGMITNRLSTQLISLSRENNIKTFVDTKSREIKKFAGCYLLKPNKHEFSLLKSMQGLDLQTDQFFCEYLYKNLGIKNILRSLGEDGVELYHDGFLLVNINGHTCDVKELSGAGDSLLAATVHLHGRDISLQSSVKMANKAASIFISQGVKYRIKQKDLQQMQE